MNKFHFVSARPESATQSALHQSLYNPKSAGNQSFSLNKFNILRATTALASTLAMGLGMGPLFLGIGAAVFAQNAAYADDATSLGDTFTTNWSGVQHNPAAGDRIIMKGSLYNTYSYDGTNNLNNALDSVGFLDANGDGEPDAHSSGTVSANEWLNVVGGTSIWEAPTQATSSSDNSATSLSITDSIGGTFSYDDNRVTKDDGTASLGRVRLQGQPGAQGDGVAGVSGGSSTLSVGDNIYAAKTSLEAGYGAAAGTHDGGDGGDATLIVGGNVVGDLVLQGAYGSRANTSTNRDGGNGGAALADIEGNVTGDLIEIEGGYTYYGYLSAKAGLGGSATVYIAGNITSAVKLDDGISNDIDGDGIKEDGAAATLVLDGTSAQTITGDIYASADGEGEVVINNSAGVTITGAIGTSDKDIGTITQTSGATIYNGSVDVREYIQTDGTLQADSTFTATALNRDTGAGTAIFTGDATIGTLIGVDGAGDTVFAGNADVTNYTHGSGNIDFKSNFTSTIYNHVGGDLTFSGTDGQTVAVAGDEDDTDGGLILDAGNITVSNASTSGVTFANAVTLSGGNITIAENSIATFGNNISMAMGSLNVRDGGMAAINSALTLTSGTASTIGGGTSGTLQINDTLTVASGTVLNLAEGSTLALGITEGTAIIADGTLDATGPITLTANSMQDGDSVIVSTNGLEESDFAAVESTNFVDYAFSMENGSIILMAGARSITISASELGLTPSELEQFLAAFNNSTNTAFSEYVATISGDDAALVADQTTVQEETLSASAGAISGAVNQVAEITADRLASLRTGDGYGLEADQAATGFATGDGEMNRNMWGKFFYSVSDQDSADNADGYEADTTGFAVGSDTEAGGNMRIGVSLAMSQSDVDGKGGGDAQSDIDSYQLTAYGDLTRSDYFIDWQAGAATSRVETSTVVDPASGVSGSNSDYDSMTYFARVGAGMPIDMSAEDTGESARFTPYGSLGFQRISSDSYNLLFPDDPGLNQRVSPDDVNELSLSLGGRYTLSVPTDGGGTLSPQVRGALSYNFIGNTAEATSSYNDGTELTVKGVEAEKFGASLGAGINYTSDTTTLGFDIDSTLKDGYASYTGTLNFRLQF